MDIIRHLLNAKSNVNAKDAEGNTPLHIAVCPKSRIGGLDVTVREELASTLVYCDLVFAFISSVTCN